MYAGYKRRDDQTVLTADLGRIWNERNPKLKFEVTEIGRIFLERYAKARHSEVGRILRATAKIWTSRVQPRYLNEEIHNLEITKEGRILQQRHPNT